MKTRFAQTRRKKLEKLYTEYHRLMLAVAQRVLPNPAEAEDAVQTAWERVIANFPQMAKSNTAQTRGFFADGDAARGY